MPAMFDDDDLQEEIRTHLEMAAKDRLADGEDATSARQASLKEFGNVTLTREAAKRVWTPHWIETLMDVVSDVRYALRALLRNPVFAITVVGVLAIGIGVNATVFTMLKSIALTPLAGVERSAHLNVVYGETSTGRDLPVSYPDFVALRDQPTGFAGVMGSRLTAATLGRGRGARQVWTEIVSSNYFDVLGVQPGRGRLFQPSDETAPGRPAAVVISDGLWRRDYSADPDILGKTIEVNNVMLTVVGVTNPRFHGTIVSYDVELFVPVMIAPTLGLTFGSAHTTPAEILSDRRAAVFYVMGYLQPATTLAQASVATNNVWNAQKADRPLNDVVTRLGVVRFWQYPGSAQANVLPMLLVLSAMGLLVLATACANIAGLVVVRGISRRGEIALRLALGASRARIVRLLIVENLVLAIPGAVLGVALAAWAMPVVFGYAVALAAPARLFFNMQTDALVIGFAAAVGAGCALVFGFVPALRTSQIDLVSVIKEEGPRGTNRGRLRSALVVAQVAVSLLLLVGAGLVQRSLESAQRAERGYSDDHVTAVYMDLKANGYNETTGRQFYKRLIEAARAQTGIDAVSLAASTPLTFLETKSQPVELEGHALKRGEDLSMLSNVVGSNYFETLRIPLVAGREFEDRDNEESRPVAVVNKTLADKFWGSGAAAIGKRVRIGQSDWRTVVGVAADIKYVRVNESPRPYIYLPLMQSYVPVITLHTRGRASTDVLVDQARAVVQSLDAELPIVSARSLSQATRGALLFFNFMSSMLFIFGVAGMALAALGTYGLVSYTVSQSTHEIGIRMALGATGPAVVRSFLTRGLRLGVVGAVLGVAAALAATQLLGSVLFGVSATDALSFIQAIAIVIIGVALATLIPAWRASRINPLRALRHN